MVQADFTAYSLYTGPSHCKNLFDDISSPWVVGRWDGINKDTSKKELKRDIDYRIDVVVDALKKMLPHFKTPDRHLVIPEFFFHCAEGPYPYKKIDGKHYPFEYIIFRLKKRLKNCIRKDDTNWYTIIIGSALTSNVKNYEAFLTSHAVLDRQYELNKILRKHDIFGAFEKHNHRTWKRSSGFNRSVNPRKSSALALDNLNEFMRIARGNPLCTVRNRCAYFHFNKSFMREVEVFVFEKQSESTIDLTMGIFSKKKKIKTGGMITEWLANYPSYSNLGGDKQTASISTGARISHSPYDHADIGVEICLDHYFQRLRRSVDMTVKKSGANADNFPLVKQFISSGGMQIYDFAVATKSNSVIFNADGCHHIGHIFGGNIFKGGSRSSKGITHGVYTQSIQSRWTGRDKITYHSHSQIAFTTKDSKIDSYDNARGLNNTKALTYDGSKEHPRNKMTDSLTPTVYPMKIDQNIFALNKGELHYYDPA